MKFLFLFAAIFSISTIACPDLNGTYTCTDEEGAYPMSIKQSGVHFSITDDEGTEELIADGQIYDVIDEEFAGQIAASCETQSLNFQMQGDIQMENSATPINVAGSFSKTTQGFSLVTQFVLLTPPSQTYMSEIHCKKN